MVLVPWWVSLILAIVAPAFLIRMPNSAILAPDP